MHVRLVLLEVAAIEKQRQHQKPVQVVTFARQEQQYAISFRVQPEHRTSTQVKVWPVPAQRSIVETVSGVQSDQLSRWIVQLVSFVIQIVKMDTKQHVMLACTYPIPNRADNSATRETLRTQEIVFSVARVTTVHVVQETILRLKDSLVRLVPLLTLVMSLLMSRNLKVKISVNHVLLVLIVPILQWRQLLQT